MNGLELYLLGRKLMKLGEQAIPAAGFHELPTSVRSVLVDVLSHPGSSISDITARTGFPQSHVSTSVARLRAAGALAVDVDQADRRRTLVSPASGIIERGRKRASVAIDETVAKALGSDHEDGLGEVLAALDLLARRLTPRVQARIGSGNASTGATREGAD